MRTLILALLLSISLVSLPALAEEPRVDLNTATVEQLCTLPGIGKKKAEAIITLREQRPFIRLTQLLSIKGIGPRTLQKLKPHVIVVVQK